MAYLAVDKEGKEYIYPKAPIRESCYWIGYTTVVSNGGWYRDDVDMEIELPKGSIEKLIGRVLTWEDEPVEIK